VAHTVVQPGQFIVSAGTSNGDVKYASCPPSSFSAGQNAVKCSLWQDCPLGYGLKTEGTASSDRVCEPCTQGTSFSDVSDGSDDEAAHLLARGLQVELDGWTYEAAPEQIEDLRAETQLNVP